MSETRQLTYIIEHMEADTLSTWSLVEYMHTAAAIATPATLKLDAPGPGFSCRLMITNLSQENIDLLRKEGIHESAILETRKVLDMEFPAEEICLFDLEAKETVSPADGQVFKYFVIGGILGDHPPRARTSKLRELSCEIRLLGDYQMSSDTATIVSYLITACGKNLADLPLIDNPTFQLGPNEGVEMPFRYLTNPDTGRPLVPKGFIRNLRRQNAASLVVNSIKKWVDNYAVDFLENPEMTKTLQAFMSSIDPSDTASVLHLGRALDRLLANNPADRNGRGRGGALSVEELTQSEVSAVALARARLDQAKDSSQGGQDRQGTNLDRLIGRWANPRPSAPIAGTRYASFLEIDPLEFARQLTMIEFELFCQIRAQDFHDLAWMSKNKETLAFGATQLTRWSTRISHWVITEIVSHTSDIKARAQCYERFLVIAGHLDKMNNFNGCIEILTALNSSPVYRLKNTVAYLPTKVRRESEKLFRSFSSDLNYKNLRQRVQQHNDVPLIPFPGVYMQDLVFLDGGAKNFLDEDKGVINFIKHATASRYITSLLKHQKLEYTFEIKKEIRDFICTGLPIIQSEDEHYNLSLQCEPRGTN
ncbi:hypothetical protein H696_04453 [Fonticula alba]|uniref:Ras-GEF domain-containing protein n=1 Tax=Fonticula alba TaxID=691883 RepID=A0A058Z547_FONAL|nr:hypothetical protein H696_04453 [Fonticula alba]KCV69033.1 hypothetical protein H696_04453 [Fonticula alba]|eukprot:XP_009496604.1 hypothetical protein H696_04453 [Fonticula alba]